MSRSLFCEEYSPFMRLYEHITVQGFASLTGVSKALKYISWNKLLLTDILRNEWGYDGLVVSDWGAVDDRPLGVAAGLDLEMPTSKL